MSADDAPRRGDGYATQPSGDLIAMSFPGARRIAGWLFWVVFPALCVASLYLAGSAIADHVGRQPDGVRGSYVAHRICLRSICLVGGTFTSDDGHMVVTSLLGDPRWAEGSKHTVYYDGRSAEVVGPGTWDPTPSVLAAVGGLTYLAIVVWLAVAQSLHRRRQPRALAPTTEARRDAWDNGL
jgi:hypothetical protein